MDAETRFWEKVNIGKGCWLWGAAMSSDGYGMFWWQDRTQRAHRVAWEITHQTSLSKDTYICHHCDVRRCVRPAHLFAGDAEMNARDRDRKRRGSGFLDPERVQRIRRLYVTGYWTYEALGKVFGTHSTNIGLIVRYRTWTNV